MFRIKLKETTLTAETLEELAENIYQHASAQDEGWDCQSFTYINGYLAADYSEPTRINLFFDATGRSPITPRAVKEYAQAILKQKTVRLEV